MFSCKFCKISKNTIFTEHLQANASVWSNLQNDDFQYIQTINWSMEIKTEDIVFVRKWKFNLKPDSNSRQVPLLTLSEFIQIN